VSRALVPAFLLAAYMLAFGLSSLTGGLLAFDDHPGQLYRLHHAVSVGWAPWRFNPGWWAGYAELQYYPPGAAWLGASIRAASLGHLDVARSYEVVLWIAWVLPGVTTLALLTRVLGNGWLALPGAFLALTLSAGSRSGVEEGLRWGLVAARLGWGLLPLVALSLVDWVEGARRAPLLAAPLIAAVVLFHPAHAPCALAMLLLAAWLGRSGSRGRGRQAAAVAGLAIGLSAVWLLPLLVHLGMARALAWGDSSPLGLLRQLGRPLLALLLLAQVAAGISMQRARDGSVTERWLSALTPTLAVVIALDAIVGATTGLLWLPADRLADSVLLALILGASLAAPRVASRIPRLGAAPLAAGLLLIALLLSGGSPEAALTLWPTRAEWPKYDAVVHGVRLDALWQALRAAPPGRVLFLRSGVRLDYRPEWWRPHSHISALTPVESGRAIVNGTFTHPSPVAGILYTGSAAPEPITALAERRDGVLLFGEPVGSLAPGTFQAWADRLGISTIVASDEDPEPLPFLEARYWFTTPRLIGPFRVYFARSPRPLPEPLGPQTWRLAHPAAEGGWRLAGFAYSPLWTASSGGRLLPVRDHDGMLEILTSGAHTDIILRHQPGLTERAGALASSLSVMTLALAGLGRMWRRREEPPARDG
jgi:hypothetical protein